VRISVIDGFDSCNLEIDRIQFDDGATRAWLSLRDSMLVSRSWFLLIVRCQDSVRWFNGSLVRLCFGCRRLGRL
jgi:hypothetical protein